MSALDDYIATNTPTNATSSSAGATPAPVTAPASTGGSALDQYIKSTGKTIDITPTAPKPTTSSLADKYLSFSNRLGQLGAEFDTGIVKGVGGIVGGVETIGQGLGSIGIAVNHALGGKAVQEQSNVGDSIKEFSNEMDKKTGVQDKKYLDNVFEGLGTAVPYIAGGAAAKLANIPALVSAVGIGGIQALDTAKTDYNEMIANGTPHAPAKAAGVFAVDLAFNTAAHYLGPLAQGGNSSLASSVARFLKSTVLETANYGFGQTVVSNVATGRPPMQGVWDSVLTMLPISAGFGLAGEGANREQIKQVESVMKGVAESGGTLQDAVKIISELSGVETAKVQNTLDRYIADNPDVGEKYQSNTDDKLKQIAENVRAQVPLDVAEAEYAKTKPAKARVYSENVEEPKPATVPEKTNEEVAAEHAQTLSTEEPTPSTDIEEPKPVVEGDTVDIKSPDGTVTESGVTVEKITEIDGKQYVKIEGSDIYTPIDQLEQKTEGKMKRSLKGQRIEASAIERGLTEGFKGTALYEASTVKDQSERIADIMNNDFERAQRIVTGEEPVPPGISGSFFLNAMDEYNRHTNDVELAEKIANSPIGSAGSIHAQEMRFMRERNPDSSSYRISEVKETREKSVEKKLGKKTTVAKEKAKVVTEIKTEIDKNAVTKTEWSSFIDSIEC